MLAPVAQAQAAQQKHIGQGHQWGKHLDYCMIGWATSGFIWETTSTIGEGYITMGRRVP